MVDPFITPFARTERLDSLAKVPVMRVLRPESEVLLCRLLPGATPSPETLWAMIEKRASPGKQLMHRKKINCTMSWQALGGWGIFFPSLFLTVRGQLVSFQQINLNC